MKYPSLAILVPIWKENDKMLNQNREVFSKIDYPGEYQVYWLLHHTDRETIQRAQKLKGQFKIIIDRMQPPTKAGALTNAIKNVGEDIIGVFDVECIPTPDYFMEGVKTLLESKPKGVRMVFGEERFYNADKNWLTRCQELEMMDWNFFKKHMLIHQSGGYVPLSGSGYFIWRKDMLEVNGWSSETVTEDEDLTLRLVQAKKKMKYFEATNYVEAVPDFMNFFRQRIRWSKGSFQVAENWKNMKSLNKAIHKTFTYLKFSPIFSFIWLLKYPAAFYLFSVSVGIAQLLSVFLLALFLFVDFEFMHWEYQKRHGILSRKLTYSMFFFGLIELFIPLFAYIQLKTNPLYWYHTKKWGIWNLKEFLKRLFLK